MSQPEQQVPITIPDRKVPFQYIIQQLQQKLADRDLENATLRGQIIVMQQEINDSNKEGSDGVAG